MAGATRSVSIVDIIDREPIGAFQILVFVLCSLIQLLDGFDAQAMGFVAPAIARELALNPAQLGQIFGAGTIGMTLSVLILAPLADRWGRRPLTIICTFVFGLFTLATATAGSFSALVLFRFLAGLGLGAATACLIPLVSEYSPQRRRGIAVSVVIACWPLGAVLGGTISAHLIPAWGWQSVFLVGGALPLLLVIALALVLPESIRFMVGKSQPPERIAAAIRKVFSDITFSPGTEFTLPETKLPGVPAKHLFAEGRATSTALLWVVFFINFMFLFFMYNWLPSLLRQAGQPLSTAIFATVGFNLGGAAGGMILGLFMDRFGQYPVLSAAYALAALFVGSIGFVAGSFAYLMPVVILAGFCCLGAQVCVYALAASLYPTMIRSTGVGWAIGVGRLGSIIGPVVGGFLLSFGWMFGSLFLIASLLLLGITIALILLWQVALAQPGKVVEIPAATDAPSAMSASKSG